MHTETTVGVICCRNVLARDWQIAAQFLYIRIPSQLNWLIGLTEHPRMADPHHNQDFIKANDCISGARRASSITSRESDVDPFRAANSSPTGLSGSGKSSSPSACIYAEGPAPLCRKPVGLCARQFLELMSKTRCRSDRGPVPGHFPSSRRRASKNPRSTVGTVTGIHGCVGGNHQPGARRIPARRRVDAAIEISDRLSRMIRQRCVLPDGTRLAAAG